MDNLGISLQDYASGQMDNSFFTGNASQEELGSLLKALEAGEMSGGASVNTQTPGLGAALKVESLERNLKLLTFREEDIRLWRSVPKMAAYNTVEEFNQLASYGQDRGGFNLEGELPETEDSTYVRRAEKIKFMGTTRVVTHPMTLVNVAIGNIIDRETKNGMMWMLRKTDRSLAFGDEQIVPTEFNGYYAQHQKNDAWSSLDAYQNSEVVIDLRGASLKQEDIENATQGILANFGYGDKLFAPPQVLSDFSKDYFDRQRFPMTSSNGGFGGTVGTVVKQVMTSAGNVDLEYDIFLKGGQARRTSSGATSLKAPNAPAAGTGAGGGAKAAVTDTLNRFKTAGAGDYFYGVAAVNRYGESAITPLGTSALTLAATESANLSFTDGGGAVPATGYVIYRSKKTPGPSAIADVDLYPIFSVSVSQRAAGYDGGAENLVRDRNRFMAGTEQAFLIQGNDEVWAVKQLAPMMKMDLAVLSPAYRFMILQYLAAFLYAPKKMVRFINIGPYVKPS